MEKAPDTQKPAGSTSEKYLCPKCGQRTMIKGPKTAKGKQRWMCMGGSGRRTYCYSTTNPANPHPIDQAGRQLAGATNPQFRRPLGGTKRFVVTAAQNATPVHEFFWGALEGYCKATGAELIVIPIRYKNPTSRWTESQSNEEFWRVPRETLYNQRKKLCRDLVLLGDIKTRPTATRPLSGFEGISHGESCIIGHPKLQLTAIPTPQNKLPKLLTTTGACTVVNYTDSKAGKKGEFHHTLGACVVEVDGSSFHMRQINACRDGSFIDIDREYLPDGTNHPAPPALGLIMGDTHVRFVDPSVVEATFGEGGIADTFNVKTLVWHDLLDGYAVNPHHRDDPFIRLAKHKSGANDVKAEILQTIEFLRKYSANRSSVVVPSNHDDFLNRWMRTADWRNDPVNAEFYLETARLMAAAAKVTDIGASTVDPFRYWGESMLTDKDHIRFLPTNTSFMLGNIECGFHGDKGPNGSRATVLNMSRLGVRVISGHGHSPAIEEGHMRVGTSTQLQAEYTSGPSSWMNTHAVVYANSKRTLINIIDGKWRT